MLDGLKIGTVQHYRTTGHNSNMFYLSNTLVRQSYTIANHSAERGTASDVQWQLALTRAQAAISRDQALLWTLWQHNVSTHLNDLSRYRMKCSIYVNYVFSI